VEIHSEPDDWDAAGADVLLEMLLHTYLIRAFEEAGVDLVKEKLVHGPWHVSIGQEGGAVGAMSLLRSTDQIAAAHRAHHQFLAKALRHVSPADLDPRTDPVPDVFEVMMRRTLSEILGLADGFCGGRGGSMHLRWQEAGILGTNGIVGGGVPLATGVAWSRKMQNRDDVVVSFFGDGAINMGAVTESMNMAALYQVPICFFIENNLYAISTTLAESSRETRLSSRGGAFGIPAFRVDGMDPIAVRLAMGQALEIMRSGGGPVIIEAEVYRFYHHTGAQRGSAFGYRSKEEEESWRLRDPLSRLSAEMIRRGWLSPEQNDFLREQTKSAMRTIVESRLESDGNVRRIKPQLWPDPSLRDVGIRSSGAELAGIRHEEVETHTGRLGKARFVRTIADLMMRRMETDARIVVLGEDIHRLRGGTNGATRGLVERFPERILATPISEQAFLGLAGGAASDGYFRPVVELMYADFILVGADQAFNQIAKMRHMYGGTTNVPLVLRAKVALGGGYGSQHSMDPAGLFASWPGWRIVAASNPFDYVGLMNTAIRSEDPVLMIEHADLYVTEGVAPLDDLDYFIPFGAARVVRQGSAFTVLTYLSMVPLAVAIADKLGIDAEIIDLRSLDRAGIDWQTIGDSIRKTHNALVLEQGPLVASYGALLTDEIQNRLFDELDQPVKRIFGGYSSPSVSAVLERAALAGAEEIEAGFLRMLADQGSPVAPHQSLSERVRAWAG